MSEVSDIVVPMLQRIQSEIGLLRGDSDNLKEDMRHVKVRLSAIEENLVSMNRRDDHFDLRLERIERRLELIEA